MHHTHQPCKQIWAHPLPNEHLLIKQGATTSMASPSIMATRKGATISKTKKINTINYVRINILDEGYPHTMKVLQL